MFIEPCYKNNNWRLGTAWILEHLRTSRSLTSDYAWNIGAAEEAQQMVPRSRWPGFGVFRKKVPMAWWWQDTSKQFKTHHISVLMISGVLIIFPYVNYVWPQFFIFHVYHCLFSWWFWDSLIYFDEMDQMMDQSYQMFIFSTVFVSPFHMVFPTCFFSRKTK